MDANAERKEPSAGPGRSDARKPYAPPTLTVYGDAAAITKSVGKKGKVADGGHANMSKTS